ncbi:MAG: NAD-dependent epimerase/dehydratase family protein [Verrucomicrobiota bacterium]|nr:NAD-dependent epimerase/dehydratase family protein [Verrucomicrobiota bacterium]
MPRVLIAGCGYIGSATADLFHAAGWTVEGWTASAESAERLAGAPYPVCSVDLSDREAVARTSGEFDAIVQSASSRGGTADDYRRVYVESARNLTNAFPRARLLFTSSTSVYAQKDGEWVTEEGPAEPQRETARVLREAEELTLESGGIVARLAGIYGPGRSALLRKFLAGEATLGPDSDRFLNQIHRDDAASALFLLVREQTSGIYNVSDNHPLSQRAAFEWLAQHLQRTLPPASDTPSRRKRGDSNKRVSSAKLQALGWRARYPDFAAGMRDSVLPHELRGTAL